jgi:hypothetical protein
MLSEVEQARFRANIQTLHEGLERLRGGKVRLFEADGASPLNDVTAEHVKMLESQIRELEGFLEIVKKEP